MTLTLDFVDARQRMVDSQIRPNRVNDPRLVAAMRALPREHFLPPALAHLAYIDEDIALGGGRVLMEPMAIGRMLQVAAPRRGEKALLVGSGTGYGAALLASLGVEVVALEDDAALRAIAAAAWKDSPACATINQVSGPLADGWAAEKPYDLVLIEGAVRDIPPAIAAQVKAPGGRLVTVLAVAGAGRQIVLAEPSIGGLRALPHFDCNTPFIPALLPVPGFTF